MMKIDFLKEYDLANPKDSIFRIYDFNSEEVKRLVGLFKELAEGNVSEIDLGNCTFIGSIGGVNLVLRLGSDDRGVFQMSELEFVCSLSKKGWENAIDLAQPFSEYDDRNGYQWLYDIDTEIDLLLSSNGKW
jgi:hypothetical protein